MIDGEKGLLPLLTFDSRDTWARLLELAAPELASGGARRLEEAVGGTARTVAIERHYIDKDYRDTFSNFHSPRGLWIRTSGTITRPPLASKRAASCRKVS